MIVTLTLNPSVDRTVEVETLARGEVMRALGVRVDPGGKGINVSRALASHGLPTRAVVTLGGAEGEHLIALLRDTGIEIVPVPIRGAIRSNITVVEPDGTTTKLNEPGAQLSADELAAVFLAVRTAAESADWLVASGSLPPGAPAGIYADLVRSLAGSGTRVAIDTSGPALQAVLAAGPALVKPNRDELAEVTGQPLRTIADVVEAAHNAGRSMASASSSVRGGIDGTAALVTANAASASATAVSFASQRLSRLRATRRFSGSTASYCRRARSAS